MFPFLKWLVIYPSNDKVIGSNNPKKGHPPICAIHLKKQNKKNPNNLNEPILLSKFGIASTVWAQ